MPARGTKTEAVDERLSAASLFVRHSECRNGRFLGKGQTGRP